MLCFWGLLFGGLAIRSNREEVMMRTMPATPATVLSLRPHKSDFAADIAFTRIANGASVVCRTKTLLKRGDERAHVGAIVHLIPRPDSCGEAVFIGPRNTTLLATLSGMALLSSLVSGVIAAQSMLRKRPTA
uniref:hypothetical protein n=1 Tax=Methylobacterium sp. TaxID=409 RepID=UPI0020C9A93B|nr:hypothetical protein [Methylobacterium sp.]